MNMGADDSPIGLVIFDCDGVLVDSERISNGVIAELLAESGISLSWQEALQIFIGQSVDDVAMTVANRFGVTLPDDWQDAYYARMIPALAAHVEPIDGALEAVSAVQAAGLPCCVASQGPPFKIRTTLTRVGLWDRLEGAVFSAQSVERPKPAPDLFLHAAASMGVPYGECVVIEDSLLGITAAQAAGMRVLAYCPPEGSATAQTHGAPAFQSMRQVPALLGIGPRLAC